MRVLVWFRNDLRLKDNPALLAACATGIDLIPLYIYDPKGTTEWAIGSASRWWLHHSLSELRQSLKTFGSDLVLRSGSEFDILTQVIEQESVDYVFWNRRYSPDDIVIDTAIKRVLKSRGVKVQTFNGSLLYEPWEVVRAGGEPYKVFTPFWNALQKQGLYRMPEAAPEGIPHLPKIQAGPEIADLDLLPRIPWDQGFCEEWEVSERAAESRLRTFKHGAIMGYQQMRDRPDIEGTSKLSPYLHFGQISPRQIVGELLDTTGIIGGAGGLAFVREIAWRDFAHHLLYYFPDTQDQPLDKRFVRFPWSQDDEALKRWQRGMTGVPIVDAGMRELWHTGWMHNRVRMIVASFLTKNLQLHWLHGSRWFWDTLVDADLASNSFGWQWSAGCGADAAPFFRIFNPVLQGKKFDPNGDYVRLWVPELSRMPLAYLHEPWAAPLTVKQTAGVVLGEQYPEPIVDLKESRRVALEGFATLKEI